MTVTKRKSVSFHRAIYRIEKEDSIKLAACLIQALAKLQTPTERTIGRGDGGYIRVAAAEATQHISLLLHLITDTPGERASAVSKVESATKSIQVTTVNAPRNLEYMDGDAFLYVVGNDVCLCATQMTPATVRFFCHEFLRKAKVRKDADAFDLVGAADASKLALLKKGVKEIELNSALYSATHDYLERTGQAIGVLDKISRHLLAFLEKPQDVSDDGLQVKLTLKVDKRSKGLALGTKRLEAIATDLINADVSDDDYVIVTNGGERIRPKDIYVKSHVEIEAVGKSVSREGAWARLKEYYQELVRTGVLEQ